jgi:hypothetical protein
MAKQCLEIIQNVGKDLQVDNFSTFGTWQSPNQNKKQLGLATPVTIVLL